MKYEFSIFADYFQFYLEDETTQTDTSVIWTEQAFNDFMAIAPGFVAISTVRNMDVPVEIEVFDSELPENLEQWNHITECSLDIPSGRLRVMGCTYGYSEAEHIHLTPGTYRLRIYYGGLDTVNGYSLEGDDHYRIVMWQAEYLPHHVIKRYQRT
jgi:hypothetical protein